MILLVAIYSFITGACSLLVAISWINRDGSWPWIFAAAALGSGIFAALSSRFVS